MGGLVKARRIFFRKPLDCFQALYVMRVFFNAGNFFPRYFLASHFFSHRIQSAGSSTISPPPPLKSQMVLLLGLISGWLG